MNKKYLYVQPVPVDNKDHPTSQLSLFITKHKRLLMRVTSIRVCITKGVEGVSELFDDVKGAFIRQL